MKWWPFRQLAKRQHSRDSLTADALAQDALANDTLAGHALPGLTNAWAELAHFFGIADAPRVSSPNSSEKTETIAAPIVAAPRVKGLHDLPRPALRWVGEAGLIALREFSFEADAEAVCAFQEETYALNFPSFHFTSGFAQAFRHDLRRAALDHHHGLFVFDERRDEKSILAGFLWLVICENNWTGERYGYINNVYIVPTRRGQGLGHELMRHTDDFFRSRGVRRIRLTVTASNREAASLYEHTGYHVARWEMEKELS